MRLFRGLAIVGLAASCATSAPLVRAQTAPPATPTAVASPPATPTAVAAPSATPTAVAPPAATPTAVPPPTKTDDVVTLLNRARVNRGLLPLGRSAELDAAAQTHSVDMVQHNYLDHTGFDGSEPQERADRAGYHVPPRSAFIVVEVISAISGEPQGPVSWWLGDAVHARVVLNPRWREVGAGYAQGGDYGNYWTVLVGCRPGVLPTVDLDGESYSLSELCDPSAAP